MNGVALHGWWLIGTLWLVFDVGMVAGAWVWHELTHAAEPPTDPPASASAGTTSISWTWPNDPPSASACVTASPILPNRPPLQAVAARPQLRVVQ